MNALRNRLAKLLAGIAMAASLAPAFAGEIGSSFQTATLVNFDLTGQTPAAPYKSIVSIFTLEAGAQPSSDVWFAYYGDLNGQNLLTMYPWGAVGSWSLGQIALSTANVLFDPMLDGVFSIKVWSLSPGVALSSVAAAGATWDATSYTQTPYLTVAIGAVPEPGSLSLWAAGLMLVLFRLAPKVTRRVQVTPAN